MSDKNIDKDIEILKEVQGIFEHLKIHGWINDIKKEVDINKVILTISRAIEYIKNAELTKIACCTAQNCEALNNSIRLGKDLETYKKIAEKLAYELSECDFEYHCEHCRTDICNAYEDNDEYIKCIIDWARKEVENES